MLGRRLNGGFVGKYLQKMLCGSYNAVLEGSLRNAQLQMQHEVTGSLLSRVSKGNLERQGGSLELWPGECEIDSD